MAYITDLLVGESSHDIEIKRLLFGNSPPTINTAAEVGYLYMDTSVPALHQCISVVGGSATWLKFSTNTDVETLQGNIDTEAGNREKDTAALSKTISDLSTSVGERLLVLETAPKLSFEYIPEGQELPAQGNANVIYLLANGEEYVWKNGAWELFGTIVDTDVDLSGYFTQEQTINKINEVVNAKVGDLNELNTVTKESLVDAVNEILASMSYAVPTVSFSVYPTIKVIEITSGSGVGYTLTSITHKETNVANIVGKLALYRDGVLIEDNIAPSSTETSIAVADSFSVSTAKTVSYELRATDKQNTTISAYDRISFYYPSYVGGSAQTAPSNGVIQSLTKVKNFDNEVTVTLSSSGYVWFVSPNDVAKVVSDGFEVPISFVSNFTYNGCSYKCYKTDSRIVAGTYTYKIS